MIYAFNIATILLAIVIALQIANEKRKYITSVGLIALGIIFHILDAYINYKTGECSFNEKNNLLTIIDACIDYDSGSMFFAQALIIGGFTFIFVSYALSKQPNK